MTVYAGNIIYAADINDLSNVLNGDKQSLAGTLTASTTTSATYVDMPATSSKSVTKVNGATTRLRIQFSCSSFVTAVVNTVTAFAVRVNGTDYDISQFWFNTTSEHHTCPTGVVYVTGLIPGSYTVQGRWKRLSGTGTCGIDTSDYISLDIQEMI